MSRATLPTSRNAGITIDRSTPILPAKVYIFAVRTSPCT
jgi:hypothetical protein